MKGTGPSIPSEELEFSYVRSSGAGGQNVNKVNSKAVLRWNLFRTSVLSPQAKQRFLTLFGSRLTAEGDLLITSDRLRDQGRNAADCMEKLRDMIAQAQRPPKIRKATRPTFGSKQRRLKSKRVQSEKKDSRRRRDDD